MTQRADPWPPPPPARTILQTFDRHMRELDNRRLTAVHIPDHDLPSKVGLVHEKGG